MSFHFPFSAMRQDTTKPIKKHIKLSPKLRATDYPQTECGHRAIGRNMVDAWDQQGDFCQDNHIKPLTLRCGNYCSYKVTTAAGCDRWAKDHGVPVLRSCVEHRAATPAHRAARTPHVLPGPAAAFSSCLLL